MAIWRTGQSKNEVVAAKTKISPVATAQQLKVVDTGCASLEIQQKIVTFASIKYAMQSVDGLVAKMCETKKAPRESAKIQWRQIAGVLIAAITTSSPVTMAQTSAPPLTSEAIDATIYREGEVRRISSTFGDWRIVCDEINRLKQRFCSLRSVIASTDGSPAAELTVSTGEDGQPAALIKMQEQFVQGGLEISANTVIETAALPGSASTTTVSPTKPKAGAAKIKLSTTKLKPVSCANGVCTLIWTLKSEQIKSLNDGPGLKLIATAGVLGVAALNPATKPVKVSFDVSGSGFKDAVAYSTAPFQ